MASTVGPSLSTGSIAGTGSNIDLRIVGFKPRRVVVYNVTSGDMLTWLDTMGDGKGRKQLAAGTASFLATLGITPLAQDTAGNAGFRIGTDADINVAAEILHWEAWSE